MSPEDGPMLKGSQDVLCQTLCRFGGLSEMWTAEEPTQVAVDLMRAGGGSLSASKRTWLLLAWAVWNGDQAGCCDGADHHAHQRSAPPH